MTTFRLSDAVTYSSVQEAVEAVQEAGTRLASLAAHIRAHFERTGPNLALHNLAYRIGQELVRIARNHDQGLDLVAWAARNAFELNLLVRFVLLSDDNATRFLAESAKDEQQVLEGFLSLSNASTGEARRAVERRVAHIDDLAKKHGLQLLKPLQTAKLAGLVGCSEEYEGMFKFMSKYVHPSSWLVNRPSSETQSDVYWNALVVHAQLYAMDAYERIRTRCYDPR